MKIDIRPHFEKLLSALEAEQAKEIEVHQLLLKDVSYEEKIKAGVTYYPVDFRELNYNDFGDLLLSFALNPKHEGQQFSEGKHLEIFQENGPKVEGLLVSLKMDEAIVKVQDDAIRDWIKDGKIGLNSLIDSRTHELYKQTLERILADDRYPLMKDFYAVPDRLKTSEQYQNPTLNPSQEDAVIDIMSENSVSIVHGPPGTGKTTTLIAATQALIDQEKTILFCAPSNAAVDHYCRQLLKKGIQVVRIGNEAKIDDDVAPAYLDNLIRKDRSYNLLTDLKEEAGKIREKAFKYKRNFGKEEYHERQALKKELRLIRNDIRQIQYDITNNVLENAAVIAGTFYSVQTVAQKLQPFDAVFIDEAGQAIEPAIWSVSHFGKKLVLAGDPQQLPPTVKSEKAQSLGLAISVLEQATLLEHPMRLLDIQYRMHEVIMGFSNEQFYEGKLKADSSVANKTVKGSQYAPIEFIDTAGCGYEEEKEAESGGISNSGEVKVIENILKEYDTSSYKIGVITPYRAQLNLIRDELEALKENSNTVDSFQGQERDIIIISLVRSNSNGYIGFLKDYRRMNVALTRAKLKLVVIGDSATIGHDEFYNNFLKYVEEKGSYRTAWEFN